MIEKLKNWWISIMPSIGLAPVVEETDYTRLNTVLMDLGLVHGYRIVDFSVKRQNPDGSYRVDNRDFEQYIVLKDANGDRLIEIEFDSLGKIVCAKKCVRKRK